MMNDSRVISARLRKAGVSTNVWDKTLITLGMPELRKYVVDRLYKDTIAYVHCTVASDYDRYRDVLETVGKELCLSGIDVLMIDYALYEESVIGTGQLASETLEQVNFAKLIVIRDFVSADYTSQPERSVRLTVGDMLRRYASGKMFVVGGVGTPRAATVSWPSGASYNFIRAVVPFDVSGGSE